MMNERFREILQNRMLRSWELRDMMVITLSLKQKMPGMYSVLQRRKGY